MASKCNLPKQVTIRVVPSPISGIAIGVYFEMGKKNNFGYTVFVDAGGIARIHIEEFLRTFDETRFLFLMDYVDPRSNFTGRVTAKVLSMSDLQRALRAFQAFDGKVPFPADYRKNLKAAIGRGQNPDDYRVEVQLGY